MSDLNLYLSNHYKDIIKFYNSFENINELINFLSKIPKAPLKTTILHKDDDVIVVVPTSDVNNTNSRKIIEAYKEYTNISALIIDTGCTL